MQTGPRVPYHVARARSRHGRWLRHAHVRAHSAPTRGQIDTAATARPPARARERARVRGGRRGRIGARAREATLKAAF